MSLNDGERQVAQTAAGIRRDHVARYEWAAAQLLKVCPGGRVLDLACGIGYGSKILAQAGFHVTGMDRDTEAIDYAREHYAHQRARFLCEDVTSVYSLERCDAVVCFETLEHLPDPESFLRVLRAAAPQRLLVSVPNEDVMPFKGPGHENGYAFHFRHYTPAQFLNLLHTAGWNDLEWHGQAGPTSEVEAGLIGRTLIAVCEREAAASAPTESAVESKAPVTKAAPEHVAIVGLGPSSAQYVSVTRALGGRHRYCDETWVINAYGDVLAHDRVFHMDDVRIQEIRAKAAPESNIAAMLQWLKTHPGPVITSRAHPDYPGLIEFPLEEVLNAFPQCYFNSTAAYAVAYAVWLGVKKISLWGMDFTYPDAHDAEKGRACVEFWLGVAAERGIQIAMPKTTTLMDALHTQAERFYGYDTQDLAFARDGGRIKVAKADRKQLPSAEEIEDRYDHSAHPNALVEAAHRGAPEYIARARAPEVK